MIGTHGVAIDGTGRCAYVTNTYAGSVSVLDIEARKVVATVAVGKGPNGISVSQ
jgi:YVTN family beta-propeller protein